MVVSVIRTKSGDATRIVFGDDVKTVADGEEQVALALKKTTPYLTFEDARDGALYVVKRNDIESISITDKLSPEDLEDDEKTD